MGREKANDGRARIIHKPLLLRRPSAVVDPRLDPPSEWNVCSVETVTLIHVFNKPSCVVGIEFHSLLYPISSLILTEFYFGPCPNSKDREVLRKCWDLSLVHIGVQSTGIFNTSHEVHTKIVHVPRFFGLHLERGRLSTIELQLKEDCQYPIGTSNTTHTQSKT